MSIVAAFAVPHPPLIIPAVGRGRENEIAATVEAYREMGRRVAALDPDVIVISSPHTVMYADYLHIAPGAGAQGTFAQFGAAQTGGRVRYDQAFARELAQRGQRAGIACGTEGARNPDLDWGVLIPLRFIQRGYDERSAPSAGEPAGEKDGAARRLPGLGGPSEHGGAAELPLLPCPIVRLGIAGLSPADHYQLGRCVQKTAAHLGRRAVYVASGDLSHKLTETGPYGFAPEGPAFDKQVGEAFAAGDFLALLTLDPGFCERAAECGLRSFWIMAGALDRTPVKPELLSYEGPFGVGYGVAAFMPAGPEGSDAARAFDEQYEAWHARDLAARRGAESPYVRLARFALELYVRKRERPTLPASHEEARAWARSGGARDPRVPPTDLLEGLPAEAFGTRAGTFVSLKKGGQLRGCIGTIAPVRATLAEEICANAVSAGCRDPRFSPVTDAELSELVYDVDVLSAPERVAGPEELDPARYGVIVSAPDGRRGLLLPDLDGVGTVDEQLRIAARKGGVDLADDGIRLERFCVTRYL